MALNRSWLTKGLSVAFESANPRNKLRVKELRVFRINSLQCLRYEFLFHVTQFKSPGSFHTSMGEMWILMLAPTAWLILGCSHGSVLVTILGSWPFVYCTSFSEQPPPSVKRNSWRFETPWKCTKAPATTNTWNSWWEWNCKERKTECNTTGKRHSHLSKRGST